MYINKDNLGKNMDQKVNQLNLLISIIVNFKIVRKKDCLHPDVHNFVDA